AAFARACRPERAARDDASGDGRAGERGAGDGRGASGDATRVGTLMERPTESRNPRAKNLSALPTREILELLNDEDATVPAAVRKAVPAIERAVDLVVPALRGGHRLLYLGAGTSGRLGVLDASEMPPTLGVGPRARRRRRDRRGGRARGDRRVKPHEGGDRDEARPEHALDHRDGETWTHPRRSHGRSPRHERKAAAARHPDGAGRGPRDGG